MMNSIRIHVVMFATLLGLAACKDDEKNAMEYPVFKSTVDINLPDTTVKLPELFSKLDNEFSRNGINAGPPLSDREIDRLEQQLPCRLPPMLKEIYRWHDGIPSFIPFYDLLPLAEVVEQYRVIRKIDRDVGFSEGEGWPSYFLPILEFDGKQYIALDCRVSNRAPLFSYFVEDGTPMPSYRGVGHMLSVTLAAYETGAYYRKFENMESNPIEEMRVFRKYALDSELHAMESNWLVMENSLRSAKGQAFSSLTENVKRVADERAIPILREMLHDDDSERVARAAFALGQLQAQAARPDLIALLSNKSANVRNFAASALSELPLPNTESETDALLTLLNDSDDLVRISAIEALGNTKTLRAIPALVDLMQHSRRGIQIYVVIALGRINDKAALPALTEIRAKVQEMELDSATRAGTRGSDPSQAQFRAQVDAAIKQLGR
ncbi:MAG TPA: HEAT repeat domain-containing protein [Burkholderiaceae bacterium]|jgi:hypothetical protein